MKTYRVWASYVSYCYLDVEAESKEEAEEIADDADGGDFYSDPMADGDWRIERDMTEEV